MSGFTNTRMKRVTDPLDDRVKARIVGRDWAEPGYSSSGSEHSAEPEDDVTSPSLSELIFCFSCDDDDTDASSNETSTSPEGNESDPERDPSTPDPVEFNLDPFLHDERDGFRQMLTVHVAKAVQTFSCLKTNPQLMRRNVMASLKDRYGYNAAICKTKWESSGGLTAGNYEFIDVIRPEYSTRYLVDVDFASEFQIARPTCSYERLLQHLPRVFVGKAEDMRQVLKVVSDAAKRSLKSRGLLIPPWRKHRFMQNKWLGPYKRTTNLFPASFSSSSAKQGYNASVKCRAVGFDARMMVSATARTR